MSYMYSDGLDEMSDAALPIERTRPTLYSRGGKRVFDICAVLVVLPIILPVILLAWVAAFLHGGTGFYRQPRVGRHGQVFSCWKIRTMAPGADRKLADFLASNPDAELEWRKTQKLRHDPRIARFGRFLRASSIDELPQFWNVLKGEMSLIGPRPFTVDQKAMYDAVSPHRPYYNLRPGLSGLWQVASRNVGEFCDRVAFDQEYAADLSLRNDLKLVLRTIVVVLRATGN